jgi:hypothetical protein
MGVECIYKNCIVSYTILIHPMSPIVEYMYRFCSITFQPLQSIGQLPNGLQAL